MKDVYNLSPHINNRTRNRQTISFYSVNVVKEFKNLLGSGAKNKFISESLLYIPREEKIELLRGEFLGDGYVSNKERTLTFTTVSESLAWSMWIMIYLLEILLLG
jgi:intein/homing endonuclease